MCLATATLSNYEYQEWDLEFQAASVCLEDREQRMDDVAEKIEQKLSLLGATAIEDKLQESVPEAIHTLSAAGIKIWVLTGDKVETAVNIGFSCNLLKKEMSLLLIKPPINISGSPLSDFKSTRQQMEDSLEIFWGLRLKYTDGGIPDVESINPAVPHTVSSPKVALIIDGMALKDALEKKENSHVFWLLATRCAVVLCCRVSPLQKAKVVELVKLTGKGALCLAIGDGANDVGMIQAAQIGVGIAGEEGLQAVMASDYAIAQFKYLCRLMLVHGRWSYVRTSEMILNFFFKNLIYV